MRQHVLLVNHVLAFVEYSHAFAAQDSRQEVVFNTLRVESREMQ